MKVAAFLNELQCDFFTGVPDSQLKTLCDYLCAHLGTKGRHCIAHNEGGAVALAAGYYLATGKIPCVYLQNSGIGNLVNPLCSLTSPDIYGIPMILIIGWRGEPGVPDEPQHVFQGKATLPLLRDLDIDFSVIEKSTTEEELQAIMKGRFLPLLKAGRSVAFVMRKDSLEGSEPVHYVNDFVLSREAVIERISGEDGLVVSTTGKTSRELFELREKHKQGHSRDFLTVGSMGHCSMIALGVAEADPEERVWCLDGDGAALMHLGAWALIGSRAPDNLVHVILDNHAHESVGGMPTVSESVDYPLLAKACGYKRVFHVKSMRELDEALTEICDKPVLTFLLADVQIESRKDLGRPTTTPMENKRAFMRSVMEQRARNMKQ